MVRRFAPLLMIYVVAAMVGGITQAYAADIIQEWSKAPIPPPPEAKPASVKAATSALLLLDFDKALCNDKTRPHCVEEISGISAFMKKARAAKMLVAYSEFSSGSLETYIPDLKPTADEHMVKASVNKFYGTDLESYLKDKKIDTVVVCGTTAFGAALFTATAASQAGIKVVVPVDCIPGSTAFEELVTVYTLANGPGSASRATITRLDSIKIE